MDWSQYVITFDMDWALDFMIEETIDVLPQHRINFHPMHFHLNSDHMATYRELTNVAPFRNLTVEQTAPFVNRNTPGPGTLCGFIAKQKLPTHTIAEHGHAFGQN